MKNKGFVLMETIIVIVVISVALLTIFSAYNKILTKLKTDNKYDTSEYIYMTNYIKDNLNNLCLGVPISVNDISGDITEYYSSCNTDKFEILNVKKIYLLTNLNAAGNNITKFDTYMIDYIRQLDVGDTDALIIVEYKRPALNTDGVMKKDSKGNPLYETYVSSLEWS